MKALSNAASDEAEEAFDCRMYMQPNLGAFSTSSNDKTWGQFGCNDHYQEYYDVYWILVQSAVSFQALRNAG